VYVFASALLPEFITRQVPEVTEISVPGGGHLFFAQQSDQLTPKVIAFLEARTGGPGSCAIDGQGRNRAKAPNAVDRSQKAASRE
jgi:hypothetical protein